MGVASSCSLASDAMYSKIPKILIWTTRFSWQIYCIFCFWLIRSVVALELIARFGFFNQLRPENSEATVTVPLRVSVQ